MFLSLVIYISVATSAFYFILRNRFDFLFVFFLSTILYHWQIVWGTIIVPPYEFIVSDESILIISIVLLIHTLITVLNDFINRKRIIFNDFKVTKKYDLIAYLLCFSSLFLTAMGLYTVGIDFNIKGDYSSALVSANFNPIWLHYPAAISILYATVTKNFRLFLLSILPLLFYGYMGYRAELITALVGCVTIYAYS